MQLLEAKCNGLIGFPAVVKGVGEWRNENAGGQRLVAGPIGFLLLVSAMVMEVRP